MASRDQSVSWRLAMIYGALFSVIGIYLPYWPLWLANKKLEPDQIGWIMSLGGWMSLLVNPLVGNLSDRIHSSHRILPVLACGISLCSIAFFFAGSFVAIFLAVGLLWIFLAPVGPFTDSQTLRAQQSGRLDYGRVRLWGSLTFILTSVGCGQFFAAQSIEILPVLFAGATVLLLISSFQLLTIDSYRIPTPNESQPFNRSTNILLRQQKNSLLRWPIFRLYLLTLATLSVSHVALYGFASLHWKRSGISTTQVGTLWAIGVIAEILLFAMNRRFFARRGPIFYFFTAAVGGIIRWTITAFSTDLHWLIFAQLLHGATFAAMHLGSMAFISKIVPTRKTGSATTLASAIAYSMPSAIAMPVVGTLFIQTESSVFLFMSGLSLAGGLLSFRLKYLLDTGPLLQD